MAKLPAILVWVICSTALDVGVFFIWFVSKCQWEFQDPKMEVLYHIRPYFGGIFPYIGLKNRPHIW